MVMSLDDSHFIYVYNCKTAKEIWDTLEMIYGISPSIEQEEMNTGSKANEDITHKYFSKFRNIRNYISTFFTNQYLRV